MGAKFQMKWHGLDRFQRELSTMSPMLLAETTAIMFDYAEQAQTAVRQVYPRGPTGNLRAGVKIKQLRGRRGQRGGPGIVGAEVVTTAPHAHLYERGTKVRKNKAGANRGRMIPRPVLEPVSEPYQRQAVEAIIQLLYQHGAARVTGDAA